MSLSIDRSDTANVAISPGSATAEAEWQVSHAQPAGGGGEATRKSRDVVELIYDLIATMPAENRQKLDVSWLQSFYRTHFGTTNVVYLRDGDHWVVRRPRPQLSITSVLKVLGVPNIVTWSAWMVLSQHIQSNTPIAFQGPAVTA